VNLPPDNQDGTRHQEAYKKPLMAGSILEIDYARDRFRGLQKEAFWLGALCVTVFRTTPWPEALSARANRRVRPSGRLITAVKEASSLRFDSKQYLSHFGNSQASDRVCRTLKSPAQ